MLKKKNPVDYMLYLNALSLSAALAIYAYQGLFSRYIADDYCHSGLLRTYGFWQAVLHQYLNTSNRYMILVIPFLTDLLGTRGQSYLPAMMLLLWVPALFWLFSEINLLLSLDLPRIVQFLYAALIAFFSVLQTPNRYQSIYWEASSVIHVVPFVLAAYLFAAMLMLFRQYAAKKSPFASSLFFFLITFLICGFGEMTAVLIFAITSLIIAGVFIWHPKGSPKRFILYLSASVLLASLLSVGVMSLSPGNALRMKETVSFGLLLTRIFKFPINFITNSLKTLFLPNILIFAISFSLIFSLNASAGRRFSKKQILVDLLLTPLILYGLLLVNFTPSAYALSYPVDRALFGATALLAASLSVLGSLCGLLARLIGKNAKISYLNILPYVVLPIFVLYPLRAAWQTMQKMDFYRERASAWDERDAQIRAEIAAGETNIIVAAFDSIHGIKEIDSNPNHWVNRCAANYYHIQTITAIQNYDP